MGSWLISLRLSFFAKWVVVFHSAEPHADDAFVEAEVEVPLARAGGATLPSNRSRRTGGIRRRQGHDLPVGRGAKENIARQHGELQRCPEHFDPSLPDLFTVSGRTGDDTCPPK